MGFRSRAAFVLPWASQLSGGELAKHAHDPGSNPQYHRKLREAWLPTLHTAMIPKATQQQSPLLCNNLMQKLEASEGPHPCQEPQGT